MEKPYLQSGGINTYSNPVLSDGLLVHALNVVSFPYGAKSKRPGYSSFLGTPDNAQVNSLFSFPHQNGTQLELYRASGSSLYYSLQGTGAWTLAGNGTITNGNHVGHGIGNGGTILMVGDGAGSTRHTSNGTSFTNTTLAPIADFFVDFQGRMYANGTASDVTYSTTNDATNWNTSGTSDSSSFKAPGAGKNAKIFKTPDQVIVTKSTGNIFKWDGLSLIDTATTYGPSSPYAIAKAENYNFFINRYGHYGYNGSNPQLLSNPVQRLFYNRRNTGIAGTAFTTIPAEVHIYDYLAAIGTVTDDFVGRTINNAILNYNYQKNEYLLWQFWNNPTAWHSYDDANGKRQLIFGDATGQCYQLDPTKTSDNGSPIATEMVFLFTFGTLFEKVWQWIRMVFNPGCQINVQAAYANGLTYEHLQWFDLVDNSPNQNQNIEDGVLEYRFTQDSRSRFLFVRMYDNSAESQWSYYGSSINAEIMVIE